MAERPSTYTFADVLTMAGRKIPKATQDELAPLIANMTQNFIHDKYDWRYTLSTLPSFYLVPNVQDYGAPAVVIPSDFFGLRYCELIRLDTTPPLRSELRVVKDLHPTNARYLPQTIGYVADRKCIRIFPRCPENIGSPTYMVGGTYKNRPAKIANNALASTLLPLDDMYIELWVETAKYIAYKLDNDPRAGQVTVANNQVSYTGQAGVVKDLLEWAASMEGLELGDPTISPEEPLVFAGNYVGQLFSGSLFM